MAKPYRIEFTPRAARDFRVLPKATQRRLASHIDMLAQKPRPAGVKKLKGSDDLYRLRVGDYRILYQIKDTILLVLIIRVAHRKEAYR